MKKGDTVQKMIQHPPTEVLARGFVSNDTAKAWVMKQMQSTYGKFIPYEIVPDKVNEGRLMVQAKDAYVTTQTAQVMWVVVNEIAIQLDDASFQVLDLEETKKWTVIKTAPVPKYQTSVDHMSDDELKNSIDILRRTRVPSAGMVRTSRKTKTRKPSMPKIDKNDPVALALAKLDPKAKAALMAKLGM